MGVMTAPAMGATVTYTFSGIVRGTDLAETAPVPFNTSGPMLRTSGSMNGVRTLLVKSESHGTHFGLRTQLKIGSHQVYLPSKPGNHRVDISPSDFSRVSGINPYQDGLTLTPHSLIHSWLTQTSLATPEGPPSLFGTSALPEPSNFPPSLSTLSHATVGRLPSTSDPAPTNPVTVVQGMVAPSNPVPLPASLIIAGVGLVALIGLGAGGLRTN